MKRIVVATVSGVLFGFVCFGIASAGQGQLSLPVVFQIIVSRTLIGFTIGISSLSLGYWSVHGLVMGWFSVCRLRSAVSWPPTIRS